MKRRLQALLGKERLSRRELREIIDIQMRLPAKDVNPRLINACHQLLCPQAAEGLIRDEAVLSHKVRQILRAAGEEEARPSRLRPAVVVAMILSAVLLLGAVAQALGYPVWESLFYWTEDDLVLETRVSGAGEMPMAAAALPTGGDAFSQALREHGMAVRLPAMLPRGFVLKDVEIHDSEFALMILGHYASGERTYMIDITKEKPLNGEVRASGSYRPKNPGPPEIITIDGVDIYLYGNTKWENAFWLVPPYEISLGGLIEREEMREIINTLRMGEKE
jgi:hypothetical protein